MSLVSIDQTELPFLRALCFAGVTCDLRTNSAELAGVLESLSLSTDTSCAERFHMRVAVDESSTEAVGKPHFRGLHHVVIASFGSSNLFVYDILRRTLSATVSGIVARDERFWKEKLIPITLGVLGAAMGLVPMHCACLESEGDGLLIAGASGAGKSTLAVALAESYFNYVSDDWTYISLSRCHNGMMAHGTSAPVKLLPDAIQHFHSLQRYSVQKSMNGEMAYEVNVAETFDVRVKRECEPQWLVFLDRTAETQSEFAPMSSAEARRYLESSVEKLPIQLYEAAAMRQLTIDRVSMLPCWRFRYGGTPRFAAEELHEFVINRRHGAYT